ncbi:MAG: recombination protein NinG [Ignavibacteriae bacterium]|nr:recombination protein NinG [Ignavibacteriota bacterium]
MPKCKYCNSKFEQYEFNNKFCKDLDCQTAKAMFLLAKKKKQDDKEWNEYKKEAKPRLYPKKYKSKLADECQKLARMIDNKFNYNCIDCDRPFGKQQDGGHFKSKGSNMTLAFNLHNIHSQRSECNCNGLGGGRERQYYDGLIKRYGIEYAEMVDVGLQKKYKHIGLKGNEIAEKLELVRKLIRDFDTFDFKDGNHARELLNKLIGIYK